MEILRSDSRKLFQLLKSKTGLVGQSEPTFIPDLTYHQEQLPDLGYQLDQAYESGHEDSKQPDRGDNALLSVKGPLKTLASRLTCWSPVVTAATSTTPCTTSTTPYNASTTPYNTSTTPYNASTTPYNTSTTPYTTSAPTDNTSTTPYNRDPGTNSSSSSSNRSRHSSSSSKNSQPQQSPQAPALPNLDSKSTRRKLGALQRKVEDLKQMGADMPDGMSAALQGLVYDGPSLAAPVLERDLAFLDRLLLAAATQSVNGVSSQVS